MKLTKKERHKAYKAILALINRGVKSTVCGAFSYLYKISLDNDGKFTNFKDYLPELWDKRGYFSSDCRKDETSGYLWNKCVERIDALEKCIKETKPKKRKSASSVIEI